MWHYRACILCGTAGSLCNVNLQSLYMYNVKLCHYVTLQVVYNVTLYDTTGCFKNATLCDTRVKSVSGSVWLYCGQNALCRVVMLIMLWDDVLLTQSAATLGCILHFLPCCPAQQPGGRPPHTRTRYRARAERGVRGSEEFKHIWWRWIL